MAKKRPKKGQKEAKQKSKEEEDRTLTTTWSDAEIMLGRVLTTGQMQEARKGPRRRTAVGDQRLTEKTL